MTPITIDGVEWPLPRALDGVEWPLLRARCCRDWPVVGAGVPMGRCGYCNERPIIIGRWEERERDAGA
jgi:hypothetical protein